MLYQASQVQSLGIQAGFSYTTSVANTIQYTVRIKEKELEAPPSHISDKGGLVDPLCSRGALRRRPLVELVIHNTI